LQVFAEKIKTRRNTEVNHHHVRGFVQVVLDSCGRRGNVVLWKMRTIVGHIYRKRLIRGPFVPKQEIAADNLKSQTAFTIESQAYRVCFLHIDTFEYELVQ